MSLADLYASRFTFGTRFNDPMPVTASNYASWFKMQLAAPAADDTTVTSRLSAVQLPITTTDSSNTATTTALPLQDLGLSPSALWAILASDTSANRAWTQRPANEVIAASWIRGTFSPWQLQEVMVDFWHNHFSVDAFQSGQIEVMWPAYDQVIRTNALGNFRTMLGAVAKSVAMMYYLNQAQSVAAQPNENYAREVMELHTLGVARYLGETTPAGAAGTGYSDTDVQNAARAMTGWTIADGSRPAADGTKPNTGAFLFSPKLHDNGAKVIFGQTIPAGGGQSDGETFLDMLAGHSGTAQTIATKLYLHFVGDIPPAGSAVIAQMAQTFQAGINSPTQMQQVLTILANSAEFASSAGQKVKTPFQFLISLLRISGAEINPSSTLTYGLSTLGAPLYHWAAPNGPPDVGAPWVGTNDMIRRWALAFQIAAQSAKIVIDGPSTLFAQVPTGLSTPAAVVTRLVPLVFGSSLSAASNAALQAYAATSEVLGGKTALTDPAKLLTGVHTLVGAMAATPEFQTR